MLQNQTSEIRHRPKRANLSLEGYFTAFRENIIGNNQTFTTPFGKKRICYADWTASGRAYQPIEDYIQQQILPFVGNTHTGTTVTGSSMSKAYDDAKHIIKKHVNAQVEDVLLFCGSGMTAAVNKLQRILGWRIPEALKNYLVCVNEEGLKTDPVLKPVVFISHMEHHSNQVSWLETIADVEIINAGDNGNIDLSHFAMLLDLYKERKNKIAAITACSNVTGMQTPYHQIAGMIHRAGGLCFVDFACSAPYVEMNLHPPEKDEFLDAIYFSPHKFLGGPGTPGILIFNRNVYNNRVPDHPGGGTVLYSNPWKEHEYIDDIEQKEDGGTPPFIGAIRTALSFLLKEKMGVENMLRREKELLGILFKRLSGIAGIEILEKDYRQRLGIMSFLVTGAHYNLIVKLLNDRFGIQARGGCSCAGTYGHILLNVNREKSAEILQSLRSGNLLARPGWVRLSIHPTMPIDEINFIADAVEETVCNFKEWEKEYVYCASSNEFYHRREGPGQEQRILQQLTRR